MSVRTSLRALLGAGAATAGLVVAVGAGGAAATIPPRAPALPMVTPFPTEPAPVGSGELLRRLKYSCSANIAGLDLGTHGYTVEVAADYPEVARPGDTLPARAARMNFFPDSPASPLHQAVRDILDGRYFRGQADEPWSMTTAGRTWSLGNSLTIARAPIPEFVPEGGPTFGSPWYLLGTTTLPEIEVPSDAEGALWLAAPRTVEITSVLEREGGHTDVGVVTCRGPADRVFGGIALEGSDDPTPPTEVPSEPTSGPTTTPTTATPTTPAPPGEPSAPPSVGPGVLERVLPYRCAVQFGGLDLGLWDVSLRARADYPEVLRPGGVVAGREAHLSLTFDSPDLKDAIRLLLGAKTYGGSTSDAQWSVTSGGRTTTLEGGQLTTDESALPEEPGPWVIDATAALPPIAVPQDAQGALWLRLPPTFSQTGTLRHADGWTIPGTVACSGPRDRVLGGIALEGAVDPTPPPPDSEPVPNPTVPTPTVPTPTVPTVDPTDPVPTTPGPNPNDPAPSGPGTLARRVPYQCAVEAGGLNLGVQPVAVLASADFPETVAPSDVLPARTARVTLEPSELLRQSVDLLLGGRQIQGEAPRTTWALTTADRTDSFEAGPLTLPRSPIPSSSTQWSIPGTVALPQITVPADAARGLRLDLPERFTVTATVFKADNSTIPTTFGCTAPEDRALGHIALEGWTYPTTAPSSPGPTTLPPSPIPTDTTLPPSPVPTTQVTVPPTTAPTAVPTTAPTTVPPALLQPTVKVGALGLWRAAVFTVGVQAKGVVPSGEIVIKRGDTVVAKGRLVLGVAILTAGNLPRGEQTFTVTYSGDRRVAARTVAAKVRIL